MRKEIALYIIFGALLYVCLSSIIGQFGVSILISSVLTGIMLFLEMWKKIF